MNLIFVFFFCFQYSNIAKENFSLDILILKYDALLDLRFKRYKRLKFRIADYNGIKFLRSTPVFPLCLSKHKTLESSMILCYEIVS